MIESQPLWVYPYGGTHDHQWILLNKGSTYFLRTIDGLQPTGTIQNSLSRWKADNGNDTQCGKQSVPQPQRGEVILRSRGS